jgi:hypothetical protein
MAKAKFDIKTEATRPFYATVGVTDTVVAAVREYVADVQKKFVSVQKDVQKSVTEIDFEPKALREQAVTVVNARVDALAKDAKARRTAIEARVAELQAEAKNYPAKVQSLLNETTATASDTYVDLVKRGEVVVGRIRGQESTKATVSSAKTTSAKAKTTKTQATKAKSTAKKTTSTAKKTAAKKSTAPKSSAKATATAATKAATNAADAASDAASKVGD